MAELSTDLQSFLTQCEEAFELRYTEGDEEFSQHCEHRPQDIPIEERWFVRPPRSQYGHEDRGRRGRWEDRGPPRNRGGHREDYRRGDQREYRGEQRDYRGEQRDYRGEQRDNRGERENREWRQRDRYSDRPSPYDRRNNRY